jgi:23S rRNA (adenine2503-C2)-methyltransferase
LNKSAASSAGTPGHFEFMDSIAALHQRLADSGAKPVHIEQALRNWLQARPLSDCTMAKTPPLTMRNALPRLVADLESLARVRAEYRSADGSLRLLLELIDGQTIESVLLGRAAVCVSTQAGCAVGCRFCMTGQGGLQRQLSSAEIVAQVVLARRYQEVKKVVFMGMGEPAHNMENVLAAIDLLGTMGDIGHKNLVFSTVGDRRVFQRLPQARVKPALALSLHASSAELRAYLLPNAPRIDPEELVALADEYCHATGYPVQYQWTLIDGVNDGDEEVAGIVRLLAGKYAVMNLIPFNEIEGSAFRRTPAKRAQEISLRLYQHGILTKLRQSAGQDIAGACGQLRVREMVPTA